MLLNTPVQRQVKPELQSSPGEYVIDGDLEIGDLVFISGSNMVCRADNRSLDTSPAVAVVLAKPTPTSATLVYRGETGVFSGLVSGAIYFLGEDGGLVLSPGLPSEEGSVIQRVGTAKNPNTLIFSPGYLIIM